MKKYYAISHSVERYVKKNKPKKVLTNIIYRSQQLGQKIEINDKTYYAIHCNINRNSFCERTIDIGIVTDEHIKLNLNQEIVFQQYTFIIRDYNITEEIEVTGQHIYIYY